MAEFQSNLTLRQLVTSSKRGSFANRWDRAKDVNQSMVVLIDHVTQNKVKFESETPTTERVTSFRITCTSATDGPDTYPVTIQMGTLDPDSGIKVRCGSMFKFQRRHDGREEMNQKRICPDFHFVFMHVLWQQHALYNRNSTNGMAPSIRNPKGEIGVCKHVAKALREMVLTKYFGKIQLNRDEDHKRVSDLAAVIF